MIAHVILKAAPHSEDESSSLSAMCPRPAAGGVLRQKTCACLLSGGLLSELHVCESSSVLQNHIFLVQVVDEMMHHLSWCASFRVSEAAPEVASPFRQPCRRCQLPTMSTMIAF